MEPDEDEPAETEREEPPRRHVVESPGSYIAPPLPALPDDRQARIRDGARSLFGNTASSSGHQRPTDERAFRIVELSLDADGHLRADLQHELTTKVYKRATAVRYVTHEARKMQSTETVLVLLGPGGQAISVVAAGSGRKAPAAVARRAKKMVRELLPELAPKRRRTSRSPSSRRPRQTAVRKRRTSRAKKPLRRSRGKR